MPIRNISVYLTLVFFVTLACAQNRETVTGCIASNVTMEFKPALLDGKKVKTYVWNKPRGVRKDPSFAKFEPGASPEFEKHYDDEHQVQNRLIHYPEKPATLYLTNLKKSDEQQYNLVISYVDYVGTPTEWIIDLVVEDVCFEKPKEVGKCAVTTCYTGDNGVLKTPDGAKQTVMGYKLVKVCDDKTSGNYSCCNAAGTCLVQALQESTDVRFEKPKEVDKCTVTTCYTGDNGILKNPGNQTELVNGSKLLRVCDDSASGNYSCCNAAGTCLEQFLKVEAMEQFDTVGAFPVSDSLNNAIASFLWIFQLCINILMVLTSDALVRLSVY